MNTWDCCECKANETDETRCCLLTRSSAVIRWTDYEARTVEPLGRLTKDEMLAVIGWDTMKRDLIGESSHTPPRIRDDRGRLVCPMAFRDPEVLGVISMEANAREYAGAEYPHTAHFAQACQIIRSTRAEIQDERHRKTVGGVDRGA